MAGLAAQLGAAQETTYGTGVTPTRFWDFNSESLALNIKRSDSNAFRATSRVRRSGRTVSNRLGASGSVSLDVATKGMAWLSQLALGAGAVTTPGGATLTRDSTITMSDTPPSATMQIGRPDAYNVSRPYTYLGCMVTDWEYACDVSGLLALNLGIEAQDETTATSLATPSFASGAQILSYVGGVVTIAGTPYDVSSFSVKGSNGLALDRYFVRNSGLKAKPVVADFANLTSTFTIENAGLGAHAAFTAGTLMTFSAAFTGPQIESGFFYACTISAPVLRIDAATPVVKDRGVVSVDVSATILHDPTLSASPLTIVHREVATTI